MTEPTTLTSGSILSIAALSVFFPGINEAILLGAFCGSVVFVMSSQEIKTFYKLFQMLVSLFCGLWGADGFSQLLSSGLGMIKLKEVAISPAIGALFCSAIVVHVLLYMARINWAKVLPLPKGDA
ncbi:putative holin [Methylophilus sp. 3sh_L]|uniref:putative holin n=1 Tax=Methylophilus sp. 3sh_L TaxID=3377114 RepID=UPI00398F5592